MELRRLSPLPVRTSPLLERRQPVEDHRANHQEPSTPWGRRVLQGALLGGAILGGGLSTVAQAQVQVQAPQPGSLYLSDFFETHSEDFIPHGETVARSAQQLGFRGAVVRHEVPENQDTHLAHKFDVYLDQRQFTPDEMKDLLRNYTSQCQVGQMQSATQDLKMWLDQGVHHSAVNLSRGCGQAQVVDAIYHKVSPAFSATDPVGQIKARQRLAKMAPGLGLNPADLTSSDPAVSRPARLQFQQRLVDLVDEASRQSPKLAQAQADYDATVARLAEQKVSVVVAAANSGQILAEMAADVDGQSVRVSDNFWNNRMASAGVVTVGGTSQGVGGLSVADYTNRDGGIDFYADGDARVDPKNPERLVNYGTSFATPRIGAVLAELHRQHPDWSNGQTEQYLKDRLSTMQVEWKGRVAAPTLDSRLAHDFLIGSGG